MALNDTITALGNSIINLVDKKISSSGIGGLPIGTIIPVNATSNYVPDGSLPCDGTEYTKSQFNDLWDNYLSTSLLNTCTYTEYASDLSTYGQCGKFAVDTVNNKFRVPLIKDGAYIGQAKSDSELGKAYNESLPNIKGSMIGNIADGTIYGFGPQSDGAFYCNDNGFRCYGAGSARDRGRMYFDASRSSSIYKDNAKVQGDNIRLRYFVVVANGQINQSMMDWSAWASSLQGKANTDLSNLSDSGKKVIDGQWVAKRLELMTSFPAQSTQSFDLSDYLPNDGYDYEVMVSGLGATGTSSGNYISIFVRSDIQPSGVSLFRAITRTSSTAFGGGSIIFPVRKTIVIENAGNKSSGTNQLVLQAYRRLGTNV